MIRIQVMQDVHNNVQQMLYETRLADDDFESILICALRYCMGRQTYMPSTIMGAVRPMLPMLSIRALGVIAEDIRKAKEIRGGLGDSRIDEPMWLAFLNDVEAELKKQEDVNE